MDIFDTLTMLGGLALFLFGMSLMGQALERRAGGKLRSLLDKMTGKPIAGFLTGLERTSDHCSNIAGCVIDTAQHNLNLHESLRATRLESADFIREFNRYARKYALPASAAATD